MIRYSLFAALAAAILAVAPLDGRAAMDSSFEAMSASGEHQFYVWCTGRDDYTASASGNNARDAQQKVAANAGQNCWPVWQGIKEG